MHIRILGLSLCIVAAAVMAGCASEVPEELEEPEQRDDAPSGTSGTSSGVSPAPEEAQEVVEDPSAGNADLGIGDTATLSGAQEGVEITLEDATTYPPDQFDDFQPGESYLLLSFNITNDSQSALILGGTQLDFIAYTEDSYDLAGGYPAFFSQNIPREQQNLDGARIRAGGDVSGILAFVASEGDEVAVEYTPEMIGDPVASWEIGAVSDLEPGAIAVR